MDRHLRGCSRFHGLAEEYINDVRRGIQHPALQLYGFIPVRNMREIAGGRVTRIAVASTIEERRTFPRITGDDLADFIRKTIRDVCRTRVQEGRDVSNLLG